MGKSAAEAANDKLGRALGGTSTSQNDDDDVEQDSQSQEETESEEETEEQTTGSQSDDDTSNDDDDDEEEWDKDRARRTIKNFREREKKWNEDRKELERLRKAQRKTERDSKSESENLRSDLEARETELGELKAENERLQRKIRRSNFIETVGYETNRAKHAWNALDDAGVEADFDADGRLKNKKAVRNALREYDPGLFGDGSVDGGSRSETAHDVNDMDSFIRSGFGRNE